MTNARVTQLPVEVLQLPAAPVLRVTQVAVEVLYSLITPSTELDDIPTKPPPWMLWNETPGPMLISEGEPWQPAAAWLITFAANRLPLTGFFDSSVAETYQQNALALVLGATGVPHTGDLTINAGHKHDTVAGRIKWRQLHSYLFHNEGGIAVLTEPELCRDATPILSVVSRDLGLCRVWCSLVDAVTLVPRIRVSNANALTVTCTVTISYCRADTMAVIASQTIVFTTATARNRQWIEGAPINIYDASLVDVDFASRVHPAVTIEGVLSAATEFVALHEIVWGVWT